MRQQEELFSGSSCFRLIDNHTKAQLQRDIINVPVQQKTDAVLFRKGPVCELDQRITLKLFAAGAATCLFSENKDAYGPIRVFYLGSKEQRYYRSSKKEKKKEWSFSMRLGRTGNMLDRKFGLRRIETPYRRHLTGFKVRINDWKSMCEAMCMVMSASPWRIFTTTYSQDETQMTFRLRNSPNMHENTKFKIGFSTFHTLQWIWSLNMNTP